MLLLTAAKQVSRALIAVYVFVCLNGRHTDFPVGRNAFRIHVSLVTFVLLFSLLSVVAGTAEKQRSRNTFARGPVQHSTQCTTPSASFASDGNARRQG